MSNYKIWKNFTGNEIVNPVFDGCPAQSWKELNNKNPVIANRLSNVMDIVQELRDEFKLQIRITSTWRPHNRGNSPHKYGYAVDIQFINRERDINLHKKIMDFFKNKNYKNTRIFLEWQGNGMWVHIDVNYRKNKNIQLWVGRPVNSKMIYHKYTEKTPIEYYK